MKKRHLSFAIALVMMAGTLFACSSKEKTLQVTANISIQDMSKKQDLLIQMLLDGGMMANLDIRSNDRYYLSLESIEKSQTSIQKGQLAMSEMEEGMTKRRFALMPTVLPNASEQGSNQLLIEWLLETLEGNQSKGIGKTQFIHELPPTAEETLRTWYVVGANATARLKENESMLLFYVADEPKASFNTKQILTEDDILQSDTTYVYALVLRITDKPPVPSPSSTVTTPAPSAESIEDEAAVAPTAAPENTSTPEPTYSGEEITPDLVPPTATPPTSEPTITPDRDGPFATPDPLIS